MTSADNEPKSKSIVAVSAPDRAILIVVPDDKLEDGSSGAGAFVGGVIGFFIAGPVGAIVGAGLGGAASSGPAKKGIARVAVSDARSNLQFPPSHPVPDQAYGMHPFVPHRYIPLGKFHQILREEKKAELMRLLAALGATRVRGRVVHVAKDTATGSASVAGSVVQASLESHGKRGSRHEVQFDERYNPRGLPRVPPDLVWIEHEPSWQGLAARRLEQGTQNVSARLEYEDDFGVTAELVAKVSSLGGSIAGGFANFEQTVWEVEAAFSDPKAPAALMHQGGTSAEPASPALRFALVALVVGFLTLLLSWLLFR